LITSTRGADGQGQEDLERGDVERQRRHRQERVPLAHRQELAHGLEQIGERAVGDLDPFGLAG